jgi:hypothetical protein
MKHAVLMLRATLLSLLLPELVSSQVPAGSISGFVADVTGARIRSARVVVISKETGLKRPISTSSAGEFVVAALPPGRYEVTADAEGFKQLVREATVEAGSTTDVNLVMQVGASTTSVTVESASPQMQYESHEVNGRITRLQIEGLPVNGRNYLEFIKLEPGAQPPVKTTANRVLMPLLGSPVGNNGSRTRITVDGGSVMEVGNGGSALGFSQEVVQEFQVSTVNMDLSADAAASGAVNVATRSGTNDLHGSGFFFFRDHHLAAYPALHRNPFNPDPFFQRRQFGGSIAGPIQRDHAFFFGSFERLDQRGVISTEFLSPDFAALSGIYPSPTYVNQINARSDILLNQSHSLFVRYSHEGNFSYAPFGDLYPSTWPRQTDWTDQIILGTTSQFGSPLVNDLRFSYFFVSFAQHAPGMQDCPACLGIGAPLITVEDQLSIGLSSTNAILGRRYHLNDVVSWQRGQHHIRFGGDWETTRGGRTAFTDEPVTLNLFAPTSVRDFNSQQSPEAQIPLPSTFLTLADVLQLPMQNFTTGIGDPFVPQDGFGKARISPLVHLFIQDTWRMQPRFVLDYGLAWTFGAPLNYDLPKPAYLDPVLGVAGLGPTRQNWKQFSPSIGFAWNIDAHGKTVIRGGAGIYYDSVNPAFIADEERVSLGPRGVGRGTYFSGGIGNPLTDVPGVAAGTLMDFNYPTMFAGATAQQILPGIRAQLAQERGNPNSRDFSVTNIEVDKQGSVDAADFPSPQAIHVSLGVQREIAHEFVISADFAVREFRHIGTPPGLLDPNHFSSVRKPALPVCPPDQQTDPKALCSLGPISLTSGIGSATYRGLLVRADKRFSHGFQFLGSYAYSSNVGDNFDPGFNNDMPLDNRGPLDRDFRHILSLSGVADLPKRFRVGLFISYIGKSPFSTYLGDLDLNGDGTTGDLLPGTRVNQFNRGLGKNDLHRLVNAFNRTYTGGKDAGGNDIPSITLPSTFEFGDSFLTHDLRLGRDFTLHERWKMTLIGEVFNLFNIGNLSGRSGDLLNPGFGRATSRVTQVFGSGGPRSFQVAARLSF